MVIVKAHKGETITAAADAVNAQRDTADYSRRRPTVKRPAGNSPPRAGSCPSWPAGSPAAIRTL